MFARRANARERLKITGNLNATKRMIAKAPRIVININSVVIRLALPLES